MEKHRLGENICKTHLIKYLYTKYTKNFLKIQQENNQPNQKLGKKGTSHSNSCL
jgi:hypothetical protein